MLVYDYFLTLGDEVCPEYAQITSLLPAETVSSRLIMLGLERSHGVRTQLQTIFPSADL